MAKLMSVWDGDYVNGSGSAPPSYDWPSVTLIHFVGQEGEVLAKVVPENALPFKPQWHSMSLRGYHRSSSVPATAGDISLEDFEGESVTMWNARIPMVGGVCLFKTKAERDDFIKQNIQEDD